MRSQKRFVIVVWLLVFGLSSLACNLFAGRLAPTPTGVATALPPTSSLEEQPEVPRVQTETQGGFELSITESELTELAARELASQPEAMLSDPQILLRDGQITILGNVEQSGFTLSAEIVLLPVINGNGDLEVEVISMSVGPFAVPQQMRDQVSSLANELVTRQLSDAGNIRIESITIQDGVLRVSGSRR